MQPVDVRVDHVELLRPFGNRLQQQRASRIRIGAFPFEAQRVRPHRMKLAARPGIPARKEGDVMPQLDEFSTSQATTRSVPP